MKQLKIVLLLIGCILITHQTLGQKVMGQIMKNPPPILMQEMGNDFHPDAKILGPGLFAHVRPITELYSPTKGQFVGTSNGNLYFRNEKSEAQLLSLKPNEGWYWHLDNAMWSPDGSYLLAKQIDDRKVKTIELTDVEQHTSSKTYSRAGDAIPIHQFYIINTATGKYKALEQKGNFPYVHIIGWHSDAKNFYVIESDRFMKTLHLVMVEESSGKQTVLLTEHSNTFLVGLELLQGYSKRLIDLKLATFLEERHQFVWMSERSGYKQLYLYDDKGNLIRPLTDYSKNGIVDRITTVDIKNGWIYFIANGDVKHPYKKQLYKTSIDSEELVKVTDTSGLIDVFASTNKDTLWLLISELPRTLQLDRYSPSGDYIDTPWQGDFSTLDENLFNYEYVTVQSTDNSSQLQSLILKPNHFDPNKRYPVIEYIYGSANSNVVPYDLFDSWLWTMNEVAQQGYIVVFTDGKGTLDRGKKFLDYGYGHFGDHVVRDHVTVLQQLAKTRPYMDMDKVGIIGHSWGGHFALRALLEAPEIYKAGHINAGAVDSEDFRVPIEVYMGCYPSQCPEKYESSNLTSKLKNLKAPLMITHGTADDDVPIEGSYDLVDRLKKIGYTNYEFTPYQGMDHIVMRHPDWQPQMIAFFKEHLK